MRVNGRMTHHPVVLIPGDGIGPEVTAAVQRDPRRGGRADRVGRVPGGPRRARAGPATSCRRRRSTRSSATSVALKGPCTTPVGEGFTSVNVQLRKRLNLYAAVRPVRNLAGVPTRFDDVDLIIVRENTEGLYSGIENEVTDDVVMSMKVATETACTRIAHWAFRFATRRAAQEDHGLPQGQHHEDDRRPVPARGARACTSASIPNIEYQEMIIDAGCMKLVQDPTQFDVLLLENLYGDVVSDLCAGLVGGLGVVPGANYRRARTPSSRPCTARRPTSPARTSPIRWRC